MSEDTILQIKDVSLSFGEIKCLSAVKFDVFDKELLAIIGPNGAGKTAILNCISGFYLPQRGQIHFKGSDITKLSPYQIADLGIGRTFQNLADYTNISTIDNLLAGRHLHTKENIFTQAFWFGPAVTWPKEIANYPYIHFWHRLDAALMAEDIAGMGSEILGEDAWTALFSPGPLSENSDINMTIQTSPVFYVQLQAVDQYGNVRPAGTLGDIGAIETQ